jgi:AcrR family transcriptional regulator
MSCAGGGTSKTYIYEATIPFDVPLFLRYAVLRGKAHLRIYCSSTVLDIAMIHSIWEDVKGMTEKRKKRGYDSSRRQVQARATRRQILDAARTLFTTRGYSGTTIEAIANEAGVAVETVYAAFGSKRAILSHLVSVAVRGDDDPLPILEQAGPQSVRAETDQRQQIRFFARDMRVIMERVGPLFAVMRSAAFTEPDIKDMLQQMLRTRRENIEVFVQWIEQNGPLRVGLSIHEAADNAWALSSAEVHALLTTDRGWSAEQYEQWLGETLIMLLLPPATTPQ